MDPQLQRRILEEWRGLPQPPVRPDRTVTVGAALGKLLDGLGLNERLHEAQIVSAWRDIVGEFLAAQSTPARLQRGVLIVSVLQPTVHFELERNWRRPIVEKLKARFGAKLIRDVKFRIG